MTPTTFIASILLFIGLWLIGRKQRSGFLFSVVGEAIWTVVSIEREMWDLAVVCVVFGILAAVNFRKWKE